MSASTRDEQEQAALWAATAMPPSKAEAASASASASTRDGQEQAALWAAMPPASSLIKSELAEVVASEPAWRKAADNPDFAAGAEAMRKAVLKKVEVYLSVMEGDDDEHGYGLGWRRGLTMLRSALDCSEWIK